ncbi:MAG: family 78 glycoside hydrolase catalytic domain, partial [Clostridia bacterium]|nr:family 78 glycoside hydrolase catalytic domain [Clostridia bacterium]
QFEAKKELASASLEITSHGVYVARINGSKVGDQVMTPGWTAYSKRLQVETYDVTDMIKENNTLCVGVGPGWKGRNHTSNERGAEYFLGIRETALLCALTLDYADGSSEVIVTDESWLTEFGKNIYSDLYNGYTYDPCYKDEKPMEAIAIPMNNNKNLIDRDGEKIIEQERLEAKEIIITPKGETVIDFGQNLTGYVEFKVKGKKGEHAVIEHAEVLDAQGNFYRDNLRSAKAMAEFICDGEEHIHKPDHTFFGFRYIRLTGWSDEIKT